MSASWITVVGALLWGVLLGFILAGMLRFRDRPSRINADDPRRAIYPSEDAPHGDVPSLPAGLNASPEVRA